MRFLLCILAISLLLPGLSFAPTHLWTNSVGRLNPTVESAAITDDSLAHNLGNPKHRGSGRREFAEVAVETYC